MIFKMNKNYFKYELQRGGGSMFTPRDLTWFERLVYRLKCYKVIKITDDYFDTFVDAAKKTNVDIKIKLFMR